MTKQNSVLKLVENFKSVLTTEINQQNIAKNKLKDSLFPTTRDERWKYTRVGKIVKNNYLAISNPKPIGIHSLNLAKSEYRIVISNGNIDKNSTVLPTEQGVIAMPVSQAFIKHNEIINNYFSKYLKGNEVFENINTAYFQDGLFLYVPKNIQLKQSIQIITLNTEKNTWSNPRNLFIGEQGSEFHVVNLLPDSISENSVINEVTEIFVGQNSNVSYDKIQYQNNNSFYFGTEQVYQEKNSTFNINTITTNGKLVRNDLNVIVNGENCQTNLAGVYAGKEKQHIDNHTTIDHKLGYCESTEIYKGVMDDESTGIFNGKVFVRPNAQKINAYQSNGNVLLSKKSSVRSKPELEIYADDVRCSHGSTTGQLDEEGVFYLRTRGLSEQKARKLMVSAFIEEVLEQIKSKNLRDFVDKLLENRFQL